MPLLVPAWKRKFLLPFMGKNDESDSSVASDITNMSGMMPNGNQ